MTHSLRWLAAGLVALPAAWFALSTGISTAAGEGDKVWRPVGQKADVDKLVKKLSDTLQEDAKALEAGSAPKDQKGKIERRARGLALLLAATGQASKDQAGVRDAALKVYEALKSEKYADASKQAAKLASAKDPNAKAGPVALVQGDKEEALTAVMQLFKNRAKGGGLGIEPKPTGANARLDGVEAKLLNLGQLKGPAAATSALTKESDELSQMLLTVAYMAELTHDLGPDKKSGEKDPAKWQQWTTDMLDAAEKAQKAAKSKDAKGFQESVKKLNDSCANCHGVFRDS